MAIVGSKSKGTSLAQRQGLKQTRRGKEEKGVRHTTLRPRIKTPR